MYIELGTSSTRILADFIKIICGDNQLFPEHQWKLEFPKGNIMDRIIYNDIIKNRFAIISTEYPVEFILETKKINKDDIEITNDYLIINIKNYINSFTQLSYNNIPLYKNDILEDLNFLEYYTNGEKIYLLKQGLEEDKFELIYGKKTDKMTKFYVKFSYPDTFKSRDRNSALGYEEEKVENKYFLKWEFGKYLDNSLNIYSDEIYKVPSKKIYTFWDSLYHIDNSRKLINDMVPELFLTMYITYDNKSIAFLIQNYSSNNEMQGFNYIGALETSKDSMVNELDNFGTVGTALLKEQQVWDILGYYEVIKNNGESLSNLSIHLAWNDGCAYRNGTCLILVDENFDIKLFMRPGQDIYNISKDLDGISIKRAYKDIAIETTGDQKRYHKYYIFWYNTMGNSHKGCKHIDMIVTNKDTGVVKSLNTQNINQALLLDYGNFAANSKLPTTIYDHINYKIRYDNQNHKILPFLILNTETNTFNMFKYIYHTNGGTISKEILPTAPDPDLKYMGKEVIDYGPIWESLPMEVNSFTEPNFIMYRTASGGFYQEYKSGQYSLYEFDGNEYKKMSYISAYTNSQIVSKVQLVHPYELARGYLRRVLSAPSNSLYGTPIEVNYNGKDENFIYLRRSNIKDMFKNSSAILNSVLFQTTN